jgi:Uma2 family endonuclease
VVTSTRVSLKDFLALPGIEERRLELIDGEVFEKPMPTWGHGTSALTIGGLLNSVGFASVEPRAIIEPSGDLGPSAPLPDVAFYRDNPPAPHEWMTRPPHVAVEILSPGQSRTEMRTKVELYLRFGVESVWVVDPERQTVDVYEDGTRRTLTVGDTLSSASAPGFELDLATLF